MSASLGTEKLNIALGRYTEAVEALKKHEQSNQAVFDAHKKLMLKIIDADNELRDAASEASEGMQKGVPKLMAENGDFRVIVQLDTMKVYDDEKIIAKGLQDAITEQARPPRITISAVRTPKA